MYAALLMVKIIIIQLKSTNLSDCRMQWHKHKNVRTLAYDLYRNCWASYRANARVFAKIRTTMKLNTTERKKNNLEKSISPLFWIKYRIVEFVVLRKYFLLFYCIYVLFRFSSDEYVRWDDVAKRACFLSTIRYTFNLKVFLFVFALWISTAIFLHVWMARLLVLLGNCCRFVARWLHIVALSHSHRQTVSHSVCQPDSHWRYTKIHITHSAWPCFQ